MRLKLFLISIFYIFSFIFFLGCHKEVVLNDFEKTILTAAISSDFPQLQSNTVIELLKKHRVKSLSFVTQRTDSALLDSVRYEEFDKEGKIIRRTTIENTTQGCLPYMMRQEFTYDGDRIKKVTNYVFKYVANSVLENWMIKDTTKLKMFDWEDYSYNGDTIIVEAGFSITKFVKDSTGNIIKQTLRAKTNNQILDIDYDYSNSAIHTQMTNQEDIESNVINYEINKNVFNEDWEINDKKYQEELIFDTTGLLKTRIRYLNGEQTSKTIVTYSYY